MDNTETKLAPNLRFKGFNTNWQQHELKNILNVVDGDRGKNYPSSTDFYINGHTLFLNASNVTKDGFNFIDCQYISEEKSNSLGNGKLILDDVILTSRGSIGNIAWYNNTVQLQFPYVRINSGMLILRVFDKYNSLYLSEFLKSPQGQKQLSLISFGSAQPQLTKQDINKFKLVIPLLKEQKSIGKIFIKLNNNISKNQQKLTQLKELKKSLLQKMFADKDTPILRFNGFNDDWVKIKLGSILKSTSYKNYLAIPKEKGKYPVIQQGEHSIIGYSDGQPFENFYDISLFGDHTVSLFKPRRPFFVATDGIKILSSSESDGQYLFILLDKYKPVSQGYKRHYTILKNQIVYFSYNDKEQKKIGNLFFKLENLINSQNKKIEQLKDLKKGMLQKMFC